jgi:cyanophycinase
MGGGSYNQEVMSLLARWANLRAGPVLICAWGSSIPDTYILDAQSTLTEAGAHEVISLPNYEDLVASAEDPGAIAVAMLNRSSAVFFAGGDQTTLFTRLRELGLDSEIAKRIEQDSLIVAGTSAGTAIASKLMIAGKTRDAEVSDSFYSRQLNHSYTHEGSGWLPQIVFDQHFSQRNRLPRLIEALHAAPDEVRYGIGIDERTAAVIIGGRYVAPLGENSVTIIKRELLKHKSPPWQLTAHQLFDLDTVTRFEPSLPDKEQNLTLIAEN